MTIVLIAVITVESAGKVSFFLSLNADEANDQYNRKWPISLFNAVTVVSRAIVPRWL